VFVRDDSEWSRHGLEPLHVGNGRAVTPRAPILICAGHPESVAAIPEVVR